MKSVLSPPSLPGRLLLYCLVLFMVVGLLLLCLQKSGKGIDNEERLVRRLQFTNLWLSRLELTRGKEGGSLAHRIGQIKVYMKGAVFMASRCSEVIQNQVESLQTESMKYLDAVHDGTLKEGDHSAYHLVDNRFRLLSRQLSHDQDAAYAEQHNQTDTLTTICLILAALLVGAGFFYIEYRRRNEAAMKSVNDSLAKTLDELKKSMALQRESERRKEEVISIVSHDLRTPLSNVTMRLELLEAGFHGQLPSEVSDSLSKMRKNVASLINLINQLLCVERLNNAEQNLAMSVVSVDAVIENSTDKVELLLAQKQLSINYEPCNLKVLGEALMLEQVIVNLLGNAIKFSPDNGLIVIGVETVNELVQISISDEGPGIPSQLLESIFDKFKQASGDARGFGLGLHICKEIVTRCNGEIGVQNREACGSTFWVRLAPEKQCREANLIEGAA